MTFTRLPVVPLDQRPSHPRYGKALGGQPYEVEGVTFWPFRQGVASYVRATADGRITLFDKGAMTTAYVDGTYLPSPANARKPRRFSLWETAAKTAIGVARAKGGVIQ